MRSQKGANNLYQGRNAVAYVKSKLRFGPANNPLKLQPDLEAQLKAMNAYLKVRKGEDEAMDSQFINPSDTLRVARAFAENAEKFGGGNCGEHAATAYIWLRRQGVYPTDWVQFTNKDHSFVLIGRSNAGNYGPKDVPKQPWFEDAVVCDPYWSKCEYWSTVLSDYDPRYISSLHHQETEGELQQWKNIK